MKSLFGLLLTTSIIVSFLAPAASAQGKKGAGSTSPASTATAQPASQGASSTAAFESQMLAYGAIDHIASALSKKVCATAGVDADTTTILIYDQSAFATLQSYQAFIANLQVVSAAYQTLIPPNNLAAVLSNLKSVFGTRAAEFNTKSTNDTNPSQKQTDKHLADRWQEMSLGLSNTIDPFSDATSLLSAIAIASNTESPGQIVIPDSAMAIALTREIKGECKNKGLTIIYPPLFGKGSSSDFASADIQSEIQKLDDIRREAQRAVDDANVAFAGQYSSQKTVTAQTTKGTTGAKGSQSQDTTAILTGTNTVTGDPILTAALADINALYDNFINSLLQVNSSTGVIGSSSVIQGYQLATLLKGVRNGDSTWKQTPAFVLLASVANAGGTEQDHKDIWTALWKGDKIAYSGGAIVNVSLWRADSASPIYVDILRYRAPFSQVHDPGNVDGVDSGDNLSNRP